MIVYNVSTTEAHTEVTEAQHHAAQHCKTYLKKQGNETNTKDQKCTILIFWKYKVFDISQVKPLKKIVEGNCWSQQLGINI